MPVIYKRKLFDSGDAEYIEATKVYKLAYKGKARKESIIAQTPAAPFQKIRSFNSENKFQDGWQNMLIFGDNLLALKTIYEDQRGLNIYKTKNRIKLIYIDPPFATKQDFMKDREKAYRDKIIGAQFIEFLRKRLILMREILADDGAIYVHLETDFSSVSKRHGRSLRKGTRRGPEERSICRWGKEEWHQRHSPHPARRKQVHLKEQMRWHLPYE